jgi:hypothetical protein
MSDYRNLPVPRPKGRIARAEFEQSVRHRYDMAEVDHEIEVGATAVDGLNLLGAKAMVGLGVTGVIADVASHLAPGDEALQVMIKTALVAEQVQVIGDTRQRIRRR